MSKTVDPKKKILFVIEKCIEDVKQDEKHVPDRLESIMRPVGLVKAGLPPIFYSKCINLDPNLERPKNVLG